MIGDGRFRRGWVVVATSSLGLLFGAFPIVVSSFPIFFKPYLHEFHATRADISLALTIHNLVAALLAAWIGRLADRFGARKVILAGLGILALVLQLALAIGSSVWQLYCFYAILGAVGGATTSVPYAAVVSQWFERRRGLALGLAMAGLGAGAIAMPPVVQLLISTYGWRFALAILGGAVLAIPTPIVALFLKEPVERPNLLPRRATSASVTTDESEGLAWHEIRISREFWLMMNIGMGSRASYTGAGDGRLADGQRTLQRWFDVGAFSAPGALQFGDVGRNTLAGPGTRELDFSMFKDFAFGGEAARTVQFRAEAFNLANTPQFNNPVSTIGAPGAGTIISAGSPYTFQRLSREVQLAVKIYF